MVGAASGDGVLREGTECMQATLGLLHPGSGTFCGSLPSIFTESHLPSPASDAQQESENSFLRSLGWTEGIRFSAPPPPHKFLHRHSEPDQTKLEKYSNRCIGTVQLPGGFSGPEMGARGVAPLSNAGKLYRLQAKG